MSELKNGIQSLCNFFTLHLIKLGKINKLAGDSAT